MTTPEDRLRQLLREQATTVVPSGDGLATIHQRVARKRRLRTVLLPSAALVLGATAAAAFFVGGTPQSSSLIQNPASQGPPTPAPAPAPSAPPVSLAPDATSALWPFTSAAQAGSWKTSAPWANNQEQTAQHFAQDYLGLNVAAHQTCDRCGEVVLRLPAGGSTAKAHLVTFTVGGVQVFSVASVTFADLTVTAPGAGAAISSPTTVTGTLTGVDENVRVRLLTTSGKELATAGAPAGSAVPWSGALTWSDQSWSTGAIVATTYSAKDGSLNRLSVVPVRRAAAMALTFVGLSQGHVSSFDATTGKLVRQLTYPPAGFADSGAAWNGSALVWVRSRPTGCADSLNRSESGTTSTLVKAGPAHLGTPQLSPDGTVVAYLSTPCSGGAPTVVVQAGGSPPRSIATTQDPTQVADVRNDGTVLVNTRSTNGYHALVLVTPTEASVAAGKALLAKLITTCAATRGAFDGDNPIVWEACDKSSRIARYSPSGAYTGAGPDLPTASQAEQVTVQNGVVLAQLYTGQQVGPIVRVSGGRFTVLAVNNTCGSTPEPNACVRSPAW